MSYNFNSLKTAIQKYYTSFLPPLSVLDVTGCIFLFLSKKVFEGYFPEYTIVWQDFFLVLFLSFSFLVFWIFYPSLFWPVMFLLKKSAVDLNGISLVHNKVFFFFLVLSLFYLSLTFNSLMMTCLSVGYLWVHSGCSSLNFLSLEVHFLHQIFEIFWPLHLQIRSLI